MNSLPLSTLFNSDILSDFTLDLVDENSITTLNLHKNILYLGCPYFRSMFGGFKESDSSKIILEVPNVQATCDIIQSFYGIQNTNNNDWRHILNIFICKRFFCINTNLSYQIKIPSDEFEELYFMIDKIGFDQDVVKFIIKNIPKTYDFEKLLVLIEKIGFEKGIVKYLLKNMPKIYDFEKLLDLINKLDCDYNNCVKLIAKYIPESYDFNRLLVVINKLDCDYDKRVKLLAKYIPKSYDFNKLSMGLIRDLWKIVDTYYIILISKTEINIINSEGIIYRNIKSPYEIQDVCYSKDKHLIAYHNENNIYVYDIELDACIFRKKKSCDYKFKIKIYGDKLMIYKKNQALEFYNIKNGNLINSLIFTRGNVTDIFIDDKINKLIILCDDAKDKIIYIYDLITLNLLEKNFWPDIYSFRYNDSINNESMMASYGTVAKKLILLNYKKCVCNTNKLDDTIPMIYNESSKIVGICWGKYDSIIYCCDDGTINIFNTFKNKLKKTIKIDNKIDTMTKISNDVIMIKSRSELIEIDLNNGHELRNIDIDLNVQSLMKISSGYDRLFELLPKP